MAEKKQKWYPPLDQSVPELLRRSIRWLFDKVYEVQEQLGPTSIHKRGDTPDFKISTTVNNVPGCQINLTRDGKWVVIGTFCVTIDGDAAKLITGTLFVQGTTQQLQARLKEPTTGLTLTLSQCWQIQGKKGDTVKLQIVKEAGASGNSVVKGDQSSITVIWEGVE